MCNQLQIQSELEDTERIELGEMVECTTCLTLLVRKVLEHGRGGGGGVSVHHLSPLGTTRVCTDIVLFAKRATL